MNAILLGGAALATLAAMLSSPMAKTSIAESQGSMTHQVQVDPKTGEKTTIDVIAFKDP